jgi:zinc/manganese transport system substrate-binding protein
LKLDLSARGVDAMKSRLMTAIGLILAVLLGASGAAAGDKVKAVASFSILGDMVRQVGGDRVEVVTLVGPDGDAHVFSPTPADAKTLASADIFFVNGLGFEGWIERLEKSSGFKGEVVVASNGVRPLGMNEKGHHQGDGANAGDGHGPRRRRQLTDPLPGGPCNGKIYIAISATG